MDNLIAEFMKDLNDFMVPREYNRGSTFMFDVNSRRWILTIDPYALFVHRIEWDNVNQKEEGKVKVDVYFNRSMINELAYLIEDKFSYVQPDDDWYI